MRSKIRRQKVVSSQQEEPYLFQAAGFPISGGILFTVFFLSRAISYPLGYCGVGTVQVLLIYWALLTGRMKRAIILNWNG